MLPRSVDAGWADFSSRWLSQTKYQSRIRYATIEKMDALLAKYADYLRNEWHGSPHSVRNYLSDLDQFFSFLQARRLAADGDRVDFSRIDVHVIRAYLAALSKDRKKSSIGRKLAALRKFCRYRSVSLLSL